MPDKGQDIRLSDETIIVSKVKDEQRKRIKRNFPKVSDATIDRVVEQNFENEPLPPNYSTIAEVGNPDDSLLGGVFESRERAEENTTTVVKLPQVNVQTPDIATLKYFENETPPEKVAPQRPEGTTVTKWDNFKTFDPFKLEDIVKKDNEKHALQNSITALDKKSDDYKLAKQRLDDIEFDEVKSNVIYNRVWSDELFKATQDITAKLGYIPIPENMKKDPTTLDELLGLPRGFNMMMGSTLQGISIMMQEVNKLVPGLGGPLGYGDKYEDNLGFQIGTWLIDKNTPDLKERRQNIQEKVMTGLGSALGFILLGRTLGGGNQTELATRLTSMLTGGTSQFSDEYLEALKSDHKENAWKVAAYNFLLGTTEGLPLEKYLNGFGNFGAKSWKEYFKQIAVQGSEEFGQETLQQFGTNLTAEQLYDNSRNLVDGVLEGGIVGFLSGALLQGAVGTMNKLAQIKQDKETAKYQKLLEDMTTAALVQSYETGMSQLDTYLKSDSENRYNVNFRKSEQVVDTEITIEEYHQQKNDIEDGRQIALSEIKGNSGISAYINTNKTKVTAEQINSYFDAQLKILESKTLKEISDEYIQTNAPTFDNFVQDLEKEGYDKETVEFWDEHEKRVQEQTNVSAPAPIFSSSSDQTTSTSNQSFNKILPQENESTVQHVYNSAVNKTNYTGDNEVISHILNNTKDIPVKLVSGSTLAAMRNDNSPSAPNGMYWNKTIYINKDAKISDINNPTRVLLHEAIHHLTYEKIRNDVHYQARINNIIGLVKEKFGDLQSSNENNANWLKELQKPHEFIAYVLESDDFRAELEKIPLNDRTTIIDKIVGFFKDVLGIKSDNAYDELKQILFDAELPTSNTSPSQLYSEIRKNENEMSSQNSEEAKQKETSPVEKVITESEDLSQLSGTDERKAVNLLEDARPSQSSGVLIKNVTNESGERIYASVREAWNDVQNLLTIGTTQQAFDAFEQLLEAKGMDFNNDNLVRINDELLAETGHSYTEHLFHSLVSMSDQRLASIDAQGNVTLLGKETGQTSWVDENGDTKYTLRTKRMYEDMERELQQSGFDVKIYEVVQFTNIARDKSKTIKNSFKDFYMLNPTFIDMKRFTGKDLKMQAYKNALLRNGFVVIPTTKSHILIDIRNLKIAGQDYSLDLSNLSIRPAYTHWKGLFPQNNNLLMNAMSEMKPALRQYVNQFQNKYLNVKDANDRIIVNQLNNILYATTYSFVFDKFVKTILPGYTSDKQVFKRLDNIGGDGSTSILLDKHKKGLPDTKVGSYMWLENEQIMIRSAILDGKSVPQEWFKEFGFGFDPADGCAFILPQVRNKYNLINLQSLQQGVALKYKNFKVGELHKKAAHVITKETHPELWNFMINNRIAEINMDTAIKIKKNFYDAGKEPITWEDIKKGKAVTEQYSYDRSINDDAFLQNKNQVKPVAKGALPTYVRTGVMSFFNDVQKERILDHFLGDVTKLQVFISTMKDDVTRLNALKRLAIENEKQGYTHNIMQFLKTLDEQNASVTKMDVFADVFFDSVLKSKLQNTLNHEQSGSTPILTPDFGNYKQYLLRTGQIDKEQVDTYFSENGFIKPGYIIVDEVTWNKHKYANNNKTFIFVNPPSGFQDGRAVEVIGYLPKSMGANAVVASNHQLQITSGKDYDIDVAILIPTQTDAQLKMWQDLQGLDVDQLYADYMYNGVKGKGGFQVTAPFSNAQLAKKLTLEINPGLEQAISETDMSVDDALHNKDFMSKWVVIDAEDVHVIEDRSGKRIFDLNPEFSDFSFKDIVTFNRFQAKLEETDIGRLYNIAVFYSEFLQSKDGIGEFKYTLKQALPRQWEEAGKPEDEYWNQERVTSFAIDKTQVPYNLMLLNRLTHLVLDWMNNLKLFQFKYDPNRVTEHLYEMSGDMEITNFDQSGLGTAFAFGRIAEPVMMPARRLLKFKETDGKNVTFSGIMGLVNRAANLDTPFDMTLINQSPVKVNSLDFSGLRLASDQQARVYEYVKQQVLENDPKPHWTTEIRNYANMLHVINELAKSEGGDNHKYDDRMFRFKDIAETVGFVDRSTGQNTYQRFMYGLLKSNSFVLSNKRPDITFDVGARRYVFINKTQPIVVNGKTELQYLGKLEIEVQELSGVNGNVINRQYFQSFGEMFIKNGKTTESYGARIQDFNSILNQGSTPAKMFQDFFLLDNEVSRQYIREFLKKVYVYTVNTPNFYTANRNAQESFFHSTLGYYGKQYSLESIKMLSEYGENGKKLRAVSYADALMFMSDCENDIGKDIVNRWISTAATAINSSEQLFSAERPGFSDVITETQYRQLSDDILGEFRNYIDEEQVIKLWNGANPQDRVYSYDSYDKNSKGVREEKIKRAEQYWVDSLISAWTNLDSFTKDKGFKWVKKQVYKEFRKLVKSEQGVGHGFETKFWARSLVFNRFIRIFGNRNKMFLPNENAATFYLAGNRRGIKAWDIAREFDMGYVVGTPIRLSGAMVDWYIRLQTHYHYANLMRNFEDMSNVPLAVMSAEFDGLTSSEAAVISTRIQAEVYDISEGRDKRKILNPDNFKIDKNTGEVVLTYGDQVVSAHLFSFPKTLTESMQKTLGKERILKKTWLDRKELKRIADIIIKQNPNAVSTVDMPLMHSMLPRQVMSAILNRYLYDYYVPQVLQSQIDDYKGYYDLVQTLPNTDPAKQKSLAFLKNYVRRINEMLKQTQGMSEALVPKGMFYMPRTFNSDKLMEIEYIKQKTKELVKSGIDEKTALKQARKDVKTHLKESVRENYWHRGYMSPLHNSYFTREHLNLDTGYIKDYQVAANYMSQLNSMLRFQMLSLYEAYNSRLTREESPFVQHELKFMSAVTRSSGSYYKPINPNKVSKNQSIQFQIINGDKFTNIIGDVVKVDDTFVTIRTGSDEVQIYPKSAMKNTELMRGVTLAKKIGVNLKRMTGIESNHLDELVTWVLKRKLGLSNIAMLGGKPFYASRNLTGGRLNAIAYLGYRDYRKTLAEYKQYVNDWKSATQSSSELPEKKKALYSVLTDYSSVILGDIDKVMGRFGGIIQITQEGAISPSTLRLWNETGKEWKSDQLEVSKLETELKSNPEDVGLQKRYWTRIGDLASKWYNDKGLYNIPFGIFEDLREHQAVNPLIGEIVLRDRVALSVASALMNELEHDNIDAPHKAIEEFTRRFVLTNVTHAINTTQFQYLPGFFLSHFDSSLPGKTLFKQFSHYSNSLQYAYFGRIENMFRQMHQLGFVKATFPEGVVKLMDLMPFTKDQKIKYQAKVDNGEQLTVTEYVEFSRAIRMTAAAITTSLVSKLSRGAKLLFKSYIGYGIMTEITDIVFTKNLSESVNIPMIQGLLAWGLHGISQLFWSVPDDDDTNWEKRLKKAFAETFGESEQEYFERSLKSAERIGKDYVYGNYGDMYDYNRVKGLQDKTIEHQYQRKIFNDLVWDFGTNGVGETQIMNIALTYFITGWAPDDLREQGMQFMQTQVPFTYAGMQFAQNFDKFREQFPIGNNPIQTRVNELVIQKNEDKELEKLIPKPGKFNQKEYVKSKDTDGELKELYDEYKDNIIELNNDYKAQIKAGKISVKDAENEFRVEAEEEYKKKFKVIILPSKEGKIINDLKEELGLTKEEE